MFASYLSYQSVNVLLAVLSIGLIRRCVARSRDTSEFRRIFFWQFPACVLVLGLFAVSCKYVLQYIAGTLFGAVSVKFLGLGVAFYAWLFCMPALGLWYAFRDRARRRRGDRGLALLWFLGSTAVGIQAVFVEPFSIVVREYAVPLADWPAGVPPARVVVVADLQSPLLTRRERAVPGLVAQLEPDLILVPGDLMGQTWDEALARESARYVTERLDAPWGCFAVNGDVDDLLEGGIPLAVEGTAVRLLENEAVLAASPFPLEVAGFDPSRDHYASRVRGAPLAKLRIGIVHRPRHAEELVDAGFDLVVAGHTHGGQVVLPGVGPPITASPLPRPIAAGGLHRIGEAWLCISRGIGLEAGVAPPIRLFCKPELVLLLLGPPEIPATDPSVASQS